MLKRFCNFHIWQYHGNWRRFKGGAKFHERKIKRGISYTMISLMATYTLANLIAKKRDGGRLSKEEMNFFLDKLNNEWNKEDTQIGALLKAIYFKELDPQETTYLTSAMLKFGEILRWPDSWKGKVIDKHSTGGVGDKVSLVLARALAAQLAKQSMATYTLANLITKKRNGDRLSEEEMKFFLDKLNSEWNKEDTQIGALLMAIYFKGLDPQETTSLTSAMLKSGKTLEWPDSWKGKVIDKHSTGGVGDKVSLVLAPALAALGYKVPMMSGRGLEHTGGTIDKLESIPGYTASQTPDKMKAILETVGCCIVSQTDTIAKADKILYSCRDVTCTVSEKGLITGSIMSKKLAESPDALVLDIKCGRGAFMKTLKEAAELADKMVEAGEKHGVRTVAVITDMDRPIGKMIGNALEVVEAVETLQGNGSKEFKELVKLLGGHLLVLVADDRVSTVRDGAELIEKCIQDETALDKFRDMITNQGVARDTATKLCDPRSDPFTVLKRAKFQTKLESLKSGFVQDIQAMECARISNKLGAASGENIKREVGLQLHVHVGDEVKTGDNLVTIHHDTQEIDEQDKDALIKAFEISEDKPNESKWIIGVIYGTSNKGIYMH